MRGQLAATIRSIKLTLNMDYMRGDVCESGRFMLRLTVATFFPLYECCIISETLFLKL